MNARTAKRLAAYILDDLIIGVIISIILLLVPTSSRYEKAIEKMEKLDEQYEEEKINEDEYIKGYSKETAIVAKENIPKTLITIVVYLGYFATYAYYKDGKTIGKTALSIRVVSSDGKKASHLKLLGRSFVAYGILISLIEIASLFIVDNSYYLFFSLGIEIVNFLIILTSFLMIKFSKNKRAIHDYIFKTKVIDC